MWFVIHAVLYHDYSTILPKSLQVFHDHTQLYASSLYRWIIDFSGDGVMARTVVGIEDLECRKTNN